MEGENPLSTKSDFIISLCELVVADKYGLTSEERSAIDKCTRRLYNDYLMHNPTKENMPTLADLNKEFTAPDVINVLSRVHNSLEMYVTGSHNVFHTAPTLTSVTDLSALTLKSSAVSSRRLRCSLFKTKFGAELL